ALEIAPDLVSLQPYSDLPRLYFAHDAAHLQEQGYWYRYFFYRVEQERGLDSQEDLFNPFALTWKLSEKQSATVIASTEQKGIREAAAVRKTELQRRQGLVASSPIDDPLVRALTTAADQFLVRRG